MAREREATAADLTPCYFPAPCQRNVDLSRRLYRLHPELRTLSDAVSGQNKPDRRMRRVHRVTVRFWHADGGMCERANLVDLEFERHHPDWHAFDSLRGAWHSGLLFYPRSGCAQWSAVAGERFFAGRRRAAHSRKRIDALDGRPSHLRSLCSRPPLQPRNVFLFLQQWLHRFDDRSFGAWNHQLQFRRYSFDFFSRRKYVWRHRQCGSLAMGYPMKLLTAV